MALVTNTPIKSLFFSVIFTFLVEIPITFLSMLTYQARKLKFLVLDSLKEPSYPQSSYTKPQTSHPEQPLIYPKPAAYHPKPQTNHPEQPPSYPKPTAYHPKPQLSYPKPPTYPQPQSNYPNPQNNFHKPKPQNPMLLILTKIAKLVI